MRWDGDANPLLINDPRFCARRGSMPKSKADLAFTMHMLSWLAHWRHGRHRRVSRRAVSRRCGAEDPQISDRQQLR
ncbi:MAG: hypothetical protein U1F20_01900 [Lysobacterales bacterium]